MSTSRVSEISMEYIVNTFATVAFSLYTLSYLIKNFLLSKSHHESIKSLLSRRCAAIIIHLATLYFLSISFFAILSDPQFSTKLAYNNNKHNRIAGFYHTFTKPSISKKTVEYCEEKVQLAMFIDLWFNTLDALMMYSIGKGFSCAQGNSLIYLHHFLFVWIECTVVNMGMLESDGRGMEAEAETEAEANVCLFCLCGMLVVFGGISDLVLSPTTIEHGTSIYGKRAYKWVLSVHVVFVLGVCRIAGISILTYDFLVRMWQIHWRVGASFQLILVLLWLQWYNLGRAMWEFIVRYDEKFGGVKRNNDGVEREGREEHDQEKE